MPLTLNVGISKKLGQADFGSIGATCNVSVELDVSLLTGDGDALQRHVRNAYAACSQAVNDELARQTAPQSGASLGNGRPITSTVPNAHGNGGTAGPQTMPADAAVGYAQHVGNGTNGATNGNGAHGASQKQLGFINQLARGIRGLGVRKLDSLTGRMFGKPLVGLSSLDASSLIDTLKAIKDGSVSLDAALGNGAPS